MKEGRSDVADSALSRVIICYLLQSNVMYILLYNLLGNNPALFLIKNKQVLIMVSTSRGPSYDNFCLFVIMSKSVSVCGAIKTSDLCFAQCLLP